jgi:hypothetical protein
MEEKRMTMLFNVDTTVKEYQGCKDVNFRWFRSVEPQQGRNRPSRVEELFTDTEAAQLKDYLDREHGTGGTTTITKAIWDSGGMGVQSLAVGGSDGFYPLFAEPGYSLPFKVEAYYSLRGCEYLDGSDIYPW